VPGTQGKAIGHLVKAAERRHLRQHHAIAVDQTTLWGEQHSLGVCPRHKHALAFSGPAKDGLGRRPGHRREDHPRMGALGMAIAATVALAYALMALDVTLRLRVLSPFSTMKLQSEIAGGGR
jgi:hypothetical protein